MTTATLTDFDPFAAEVVADPYPWYRLVRESGPVQWIPSRELYMVTGYEAASAALHNPTVLSSSIGYAALASGVMTRDRTETGGVFGLDTSQLQMLITSDPPHHTRIRKLLSRAFTPRAVAALEPRIRSLCEQMVADALAPGGAGGGTAGDLVADFSVPLPVAVIAELLGVPGERQADFRRWSEAMSGMLSGDADFEDAAVQGAQLFVFMAEAIEQRKAEPGDDLLSRLVKGGGEDEEEPLTPEELVMISILLLIAGNETTTNLISNLADALAAHPDQRDRLYADPSLIPAAVEEVLRWDPSVQGVFRGAKQDVTLGGVDVPADSLLLICNAGANRDPARFADPDAFAVGRPDGDHLAFGHGIHFCLGASLARMEARVLFETLVRHGIRLEPRPGANRLGGFMLRGFTEYPVLYSHGADAQST